MQSKTILNRVQKFKSFVHGALRWTKGACVPTLEVEIKPRANSRVAGSGSAGGKGRDMTDWRSGALNLSRCGATRCFSFMPPGGSTVLAAVSRWSRWHRPGQDASRAHRRHPGRGAGSRGSPSCRSHYKTARNGAHRGGGTLQARRESRDPRNLAHSHELRVAFIT